MESFSFDHLTSEEFEEFCYDLLHELGFVNIDWRKGTGLSTSPSDSGRDIECSLAKSDFGHEYHEKWFVECKHFQKGVPPAKLESGVTWALSQRPDTLLIMTSNFLSNRAKDWISDYVKENKPPFKIITWEKKKLEELTSAKIELLEKYRIPHTDRRVRNSGGQEPIAALKQCIRDKDAIGTYDLLRPHLDNSIESLRQAADPGWLDVPTPEDLDTRLRNYEASVKTLAELMAYWCHWNEEDSKFCAEVIEEMANVSSRGEASELSRNLLRYPALVLFYASSVAALVAERYDRLFRLMFAPRILDRDGGEYCPIALLNTWEVMERHPYPESGMFQLRQPLSNRLFTLVQAHLSTLSLSDTRYQKAFDKFEFMLGLVHMDLLLSHQIRRKKEDSPVGLFALRPEPNGARRYAEKLSRQFREEAENQGRDWVFLRTGFFGASLDRFRQASVEYERECILFRELMRSDLRPPE